MAQSYPDVTVLMKLQDSLQPLLDRDNALASNFAGDTFPVTDVAVGQTCFRSDQGIFYVCRQTDPLFVWDPILSQTNLDARYAHLNGATFTGGLNIDATAVASSSFAFYGFKTGSDPAVNTIYWYAGVDGSTGMYHGPTASTIWRFVPATREIDFGTLTATVNGGTVWHSANDGSGSGLDADLLDGRDSSFFLDYRNLVNKPGLSDAATTSIATIGNTLQVGQKVSRTGDQGMSGAFRVDNGIFCVKRDTDPMFFVWSGAQNAAYGMHVTFNGSTSNWGVSGVDGNGNFVKALMQVAPDGTIWSSTYGWLGDRFAARFTRAGQGAQRVGLNCNGNKPIGTGYEVFDTGDGSHQVRSYVDNCTQCNCNC